MASREPTAEKFNRFLTQSGEIKITDPCEILELPADFAEHFNPDELKIAYYRMASKFRPEYNSNSAASETVFAAMTDAYNRLKDSRLREEYIRTAKIARESNPQGRADYQAARELRARASHPEGAQLCKRLNKVFPSKDKIPARFGNEVNSFIHSMKMNSSIQSVTFDINPDSGNIRIKAYTVHGTTRHSPDIPPSKIKATIGAINVRDSGIVHPSSLSTEAAQRLAMETGYAVLHESRTQPGVIAVSHPNGKKYALDALIEMEPHRFHSKDGVARAVQSLLQVEALSPQSEPSRREAAREAAERAMEAEMRRTAALAERARAAAEQEALAKKETEREQAKKAEKFAAKLTGAAKAILPDASKQDVCAGFNALYLSNPDKLGMFGKHLDEKFRGILSRRENGVDIIRFEVLEDTGEIALTFEHYKHGRHVFALPQAACDEAKAAMNIYSTGLVHPASLSPSDAEKMARDTQCAVLRESTTRPGMIAISLPNGKKYLLNELIAAAPEKYATPQMAINTIKEQFGYEIKAVETTPSMMVHPSLEGSSDNPDESDTSPRPH